MKNDRTRTVAIFYCRNVPESGEDIRQSLEKIYGKSIKLFPMPCSGRIDMVHLLRALEEFSDAVYVITCPEGECRYMEGNKRVKKRIERARSIIESIGLEKERINLITLSKGEKITLAVVVEDIIKEAALLSPSPVHGIEAQGSGRKVKKDNI